MSANLTQKSYDSYLFFKDFNKVNSCANNLEGTPSA